MPALRLEAVPGRLDAVLAKVGAISRADAERAIADERVTVDGKVRGKSFRLAGGELIVADLRPRDSVEPESGGVPIRYEDDHLLVVAKPAGLVTHPTSRRRTGTLVNRLIGMGIPLAAAGGSDRPGIVHRLDAGTSGLLIVAKTEAAHQALTKAFAARSIHREYLALVRGAVAHVRFGVEAPLGRRHARIAVRRGGGADASTEFEVLERFRRSTLLAARPRTGRTHQIRVHLASVGHPVLGDEAYGGGGEDAKGLGLARPFLHAHRLRFRHPVTGRELDLEEPLPPDLREALERARLAG